MKKRSDILKIFRSPNSVLTAKEIALLFGETDLNNLKSKLNYYVKTNKLIFLRRGIYAKDINYNKFELATKIYTPSYISLETVLSQEGIVFQHYDAIFIISYLTREIRCKNQRYVYKKIKDAALTDISGIEEKENYYIASKERAFLDILYLYKSYYFDNLKPINWESCFKILPIYSNKRLIKTVNRLYKESKIA